MTYLCVPILMKDVAQTKRDAALAAEAGADFVELRLDLVGYGVAATAIEAVKLPVIATCRPTWEGGQSTLDNAARIELVLNFYNGSFIDLELATVLKVSPRAAAHSANLRNVILSSHDFTGRPERLYNIVVAMNELDASVNKIVWTARTIRDNLEAFELLQTKQKPTIALCMGEAGLISRVLAKKFGAFLTFASLSDEGATAPGQITIHDMKRVYRWDAIGPATKVYGVVAHPVRHSMSPAIHNAGFEEIGYDGVYLPMLVDPPYESFKAFMETFVPFEGLHLSGLSITLPHKENALRYLKEKGSQIEPLAERIGTVNTILIDHNEAGAVTGLRGINTDYAAILDTITSELGISQEELANRRVGVFGAGGTGRTAVAALAACGATVVVYNRTKDKADALAAEFTGKSGKVVAARMEKLCDSCCHVYVNTTPLGMYPNLDSSPLDGGSPKLSAETLVFDTIYNPMETKLLKQAKAAGARTVGGVDMFVLQAAAQFTAWTGIPAPTAVMRRVIKARLGG